MIKILDLFSGTQSVRKALDEMNVEYEYYGIDIYSPEEENIILDLSQDDIVNKVIEVLPNGFKPDFIWASPVCSCFSMVACGSGGNYYFEKTKISIKPRENWNIKLPPNYQNRNKENDTKLAELHLKLVSNMIKVIEYYDTDFIIENPYTSLIERILPITIIKNKVDYCMYGKPYKKPTAIYSNYNLNLKKCNHKKHDVSVRKNDRHTNYQIRASVPPKLIQDILNLFLGGIE